MAAFSENNSYNPITEGVIWKETLRYYAPIFVGSMFQQLYNMVDTIIVGKCVGKVALAAVGGSAAQILGILLWMFNGLASGATVSIGQFYGAGNREQVQRHIHNAYALCVIFGLLITCLGLLTMVPLLNLMNTGAELMADSVAYMRIIFLGMIFSVTYNMGAGILRATGDSRRPLYYLIVSCLLNIGLDLFFVLVVPMGAAGVALATVIAQAITAVLVTIRLMRSDEVLRLNLKKIRVYPAAMHIQLKIGIPSAFQSMLYGLSNSLMQSFLNKLGTDVVAANAAYNKIDSLFGLINGSFGTTVSTFVSQNYGAGRMDRVDRSIRTTILMGLGAAVLCCGFIVAFKTPLLRIFTDDPEVIRNGITIMYLVAPFYVFYVFIEMFSCSLRGMSQVVAPTLITLGGICVFRILWMVILVPIAPGLTTIMLIYPISWFITAVLFSVYYLRFRKKLRQKVM